MVGNQVDEVSIEQVLFSGMADGWKTSRRG